MPDSDNKQPMDHSDSEENREQYVNSLLDKAMRPPDDASNAVLFLGHQYKYPEFAFWFSDA